MAASATSADQIPAKDAASGGIGLVRQGEAVGAIDAEGSAASTTELTFFPERQPRRRLLLTYMLILGVIGAVVLFTPLCLLCLKVRTQHTV